MGEPSIVVAGAVELVFVADIHVLERKRRRVSVGGALRAPGGIGLAGDVLDLIQSILHVGRKVSAWIDVGAIE